MEGWLKLGQFLADKLGIPGAIIAGICAYLLYTLQQERELREKDRAKIDEVNEKRIELHGTTLKTLQDFKVALDALTAILGKK